LPAIASTNVPTAVVDTHSTERGFCTCGGTTLIGVNAGVFTGVGVDVGADVLVTVGVVVGVLVSVAVDAAVGVAVNATHAAPAFP
jgi:prefoldin subunit 5